MEQLDYSRSNSLGTFSVGTVKKVLGKSAIQIIQPSLEISDWLNGHDPIGKHKSVHYETNNGLIEGIADPHSLLRPKPPIDLNFIPCEGLDSQKERRVTFLSSLAFQAASGKFFLESRESSDVLELYGGNVNALDLGIVYDAGYDNSDSFMGAITIAAVSPPKQAAQDLLLLAAE